MSNFGFNKILKAIPDALTARERLLATINRFGLVPGLSTAKSPTHSPKKSGQLIGSITWEKAFFKGDIAVGRLAVGVDYGRWHEYNNMLKKFYLLRALRLVETELIKVLGDGSVIMKENAGV